MHKLYFKWNVVHLTMFVSGGKPLQVGIPNLTKPFKPQAWAPSVGQFSDHQEKFFSLIESLTEVMQNNTHWD